MTKTNSSGVSAHRKWAEFRLMVVGGLLANPPETGETKRAIEELAEKTWRDPFTKRPRQFCFGTIERWFYKARLSQNPVDDLTKKTRHDHGKRRFGNTKLAKILDQQYQKNRSWSRKLHLDNLQVLSEQNPEWGLMPSYTALARWMRERGMPKEKSVRRGKKNNAQKYRHQFELKESRSFEAPFPGSLWHLDFHHARRQVLTRDGRWITPILLAVLDDCTRLCCHMQWYEHEDTDCLTHGFIQAIQKRGVPCQLLNDNGKAMISAEFTEGLRRLSISAHTSLPYCPEQNGKQERFFGTIEGRLMKMLDNKKGLTLSELNHASIAWMEYDYNSRPHEELGLKTPMENFLVKKNLHRSCPNQEDLILFYSRQQTRKPRHYDATISIQGIRFEIPWVYRHLQKVIIRYREWDLSSVWLMDEKGENLITKITPINREKNFHQGRKKVTPFNNKLPSYIEEDEMAPLLKKFMADYAATGLPPAYIEKIDERNEDE